MTETAEAVQQAREEERAIAKEGALKEDQIQKEKRKQILLTAKEKQVYIVGTCRVFV